jgi:peroxiredoxin
MDKDIFKSISIGAKLSSGIHFSLDETIKKSPILIHFILGTWCPLCSLHLNKVRKWQEKYSEQSINLIITSEKMNKIKEWQKGSQTTFMFISDPESKIAKRLGILLPLFNFPLPASFLINTNKEIEASYLGFRNQKEYEEQLCRLLSIAA